MDFERLLLSGAFLIRPESITDERGFFMRTFCQETFAAQGINRNIQQCSVSFNASTHTLRGMHYQAAPYEECKLVRCTRGAAHHILLDLRRASHTYLQWIAVELNQENRHLLYVPEGIAHGFITMTDATEIFYQISEMYSPEHACGVRWNDSAFNIQWPAEPVVISARDNTYADYQSTT